MAELGEAFDHETVERGQFDPIPVGDYVSQIIESDVVPTKAGAGKIAKFTHEIIEGQFTGRKVFDNVNFQNPSAQAQLIGQQRMKAYCEAVGHVGPLTDTEALEFKPMRIKVGMSKAQDGYDAKNEIKTVKPYSAGALPAGKAAPTSTPRSAPPTPSRASPPPKPAAGSRPWGNRASA